MSSNAFDAPGPGAVLGLQQAGFWAHWLTLGGGTDAALAQTVASAKVDLNPHQVEAAAFALSSPLSPGVMLADEVGLGKTIEASLVLAQYWAERRRHLLLVVPATLRKQWSHELDEKFSLPNVIVEARQIRESPDAFDQPAIVICSYEFAARNQEALAAVPWDLAVFDEAHKLRGDYRAGEGSAKTARRLAEALRGVPKLLLSATPLQNSLLELYGLVSFIDPHFFGGLDAFKARYGAGSGSANLVELRERLRPVVTRTLRRQVQQEGGISFTRRYSLTEDFTPSDDEVELYQAVSTYLQVETQLAFAPRSRHLVTLVVRKILASSSRAIAGTLDGMIRRLQARADLDAEAFADDFDSVDDLADAYGADDEAESPPRVTPAPDAAVLNAEIARLRDFRALAGRIVRDRKAEALLAVLGRAFEMTERLGGARKAVVFTESVRTQAWLAELLEGQPTTRERVVLLNGSNADPTSRRIYKDWIERHAGSARVSGSKSADMKAALVDRFRELDGDAVLLCTEAGAEGINLQFCSLLVNYDLPWNPQRVEQRIGRVHRYGQRHDVVVVNFVNRSNLADRRVFELLSVKFRLFEGVFGASDEVLGAIESGIDLEKKILAIYQLCRNDAQIAAEFDALQVSLRGALDARDAQVQRTLLDRFDADVVQRLKLRRRSDQEALDLYQNRLLALARALYPSAPFDDAGRIEIGGRWHDVRWKCADAADVAFLRVSEGLGLDMIERAKTALARHPVAESTLVYAASMAGQRGQYSDVLRLVGKSGELAVDRYELIGPRERRAWLVSAAMTDGGERLDPQTCERLLLLPTQACRDTVQLVASPALQQRLDAAADDALAGIEREHAAAFQAESEKLERWAADRRIAHELQVKGLETDIRAARREVRQRLSLQDKLDAKRALTRLERERDTALLAWHEARKLIEVEEDRLLGEAESRLTTTSQRCRLLTLRWTIRAAETLDPQVAAQESVS